MGQAAREYAHRLNTLDVKSVYFFLDAIYKTVSRQGHAVHTCTNHAGCG